MTNTTDSTTWNKKGRRRNSVQMAYSLNNDQPVKCTLISDQPFFYIDEEMPLDEEGLFLNEEIFSDLDAIEPELLEQELLNLKNKIDVYERVSLDFTKGSDKAIQAFLMDSHAITKGSSKIDNQAILNKISETLNKSRYTKELLDFALGNNIILQLSDQVDKSAYDKKAGKIFIRHDMDIVDQILLTVQELRRHWQHLHGALVHPLTFHPDQAVLINRAQLADLTVSVIHGAWELKLAGCSDIWARIENSPLSDLGRAFAREALADFRTLNNGKAASAVFETWFLSERCRAQDKKLIQSMLADYRGYVFDNADASRMVSIDLICALGEQPGKYFGGKNYLASYAQMIINDPLFTDVRDRSNANFLWFIKFEREFTQTEQELQSSNLIKKSDPVSGDQTTPNKNIFEDATSHENTITEQDRQQLRSSIFGEHALPAGNNVIHVHFGKDTAIAEGASS